LVFCDKYYSNSTNSALGGIKGQMSMKTDRVIVKRPGVF